MMTLPLSRSNTTWSCLGSFDRSRWNAPGVTVFAASIPERARHAEMSDQRFAAVEAEEKVFGAARESDNPPRRQPLRESGREGKPDVGAAQFDPLNSRAEHRRLEAAPHGFDLRQLRHGNGPGRQRGRPRRISAA